MLHEHPLFFSTLCTVKVMTVSRLKVYNWETAVCVSEKTTTTAGGGVGAIN